MRSVSRVWGCIGRAGHFPSQVLSSIERYLLVESCLGCGIRLLAMNCKPTYLPMDKLEEIFAMQDTLNKRIGVNTDGMSDEDKAKWVLNYTRAMQQEMAELIDSVPWKWWAKYQKFDEQNAKVEVVDLFHFLISLAQVLGMTPEDVYEAYLKKNKVNHERQDSGYTEKNEDDSRHI